MHTVEVTLDAKTAERERVDQAITEYVAGKPGGPVPRSVWLGEGYLELFPFNGAVHLAAVFVAIEARRKGLGSRYLKELLEVADKHKVKVECSVKPFGLQDPLTKMGVNQLKAWYKRHGFKPVPKRQHSLIRLPKATPL